MTADDFIWSPRPGTTAENYARWMLMHFRLPAHAQLAFGQFIRDRRLFCTHEGKRYRVTGASRLGDVWLTANFAKDCGYDLRVQIDTCSDWGAQP